MRQKNFILSLLFSQVAVMSLIHPGSWCLPSVLITPHNSTHFSAVFVWQQAVQNESKEQFEGSVGWGWWWGHLPKFIRSTHLGQKWHLCAHQIIYFNTWNVLLSLIRPRVTELQKLQTAHWNNYYEQTFKVSEIYSKLVCPLTEMLIFFHGSPH